MARAYYWPVARGDLDICFYLFFQFDFNFFSVKLMFIRVDQPPLVSYRYLLFGQLTIVFIDALKYLS